jgi:hypothetical protein
MVKNKISAILNIHNDEDGIANIITKTTYSLLLRKWPQS